MPPKKPQPPKKPNSSYTRRIQVKPRSRSRSRSRSHSSSRSRSSSRLSSLSSSSSHSSPKSNNILKVGKRGALYAVSNTGTRRYRKKVGKIKLPRLRLTKQQKNKLKKISPLKKKNQPPLPQINF